MSVIALDTCCECGKPIIADRFVCVWGDDTEYSTATVIGFAHEECSKNLTDITQVVTGKKAED